MRAPNEGPTRTSARSSTHTRSLPTPGRGQEALLDRLQFLARFKADRFAGRYVDLRAGARVASDAGLARPHGEDAEAAQFDAIAPRQRLLHALKYGFNGGFGLGFGDSGFGDNFVDQIQFDHKWLRYIRFAGTVWPDFSNSCDCKRLTLFLISLRMSS